MNTLARTTRGAITVAPALAAAARGFVEAATADNTRLAYAYQWARFEGWCRDNGAASLPALPGVVALYVTHMAEAGRAVATIEQAVAAINGAHRTAGQPLPKDDQGLRLVLRGIRRSKGIAQREAAPVLAAHLRRMVDALGETLREQRDRALLLVGFSGAFRRSELCALTFKDVAFTDSGLEITLRRGKTDQEGRGRLVALPFTGHPSLCPVRNLKAWIEASGLTEGPIFRQVTKHGLAGKGALTGRSVSRIIKAAAALAGLDSALYSGHSLRAGFVTQAKLKNKDEASIMRQTGHRSAAMVRKYDRRADLWRDNAAAGLLD